MKKLIVGLVFIGMSVAVAVAVSYGYGKTVTVTVTPQQATGFAANIVSVYNGSGSGVVYALVNCDTGTLATAITAGTAIPIPAAQSFSFDTRQKSIITTVCLATGAAANTNTVYIGSY